MSKKKTEINPIRAERVKTLIAREGITQKDLADRIFQTQQNVSRILNLKSALTEETAQDIIKTFPEYRIEWLLGYDDCMTHADYADFLQSSKDRVAEGIWGMIEKALNKDGKSLRFVHREGEHPDSTERLRSDCYYSIVDRDGNELKRLSVQEIIHFEQTLQNFCDFLAWKLFN